MNIIAIIITIIYYILLLTLILFFSSNASSHHISWPLSAVLLVALKLPVPFHYTTTTVGNTYMMCPAGSSASSVASL